MGDVVLIENRRMRLFISRFIITFFMIGGIECKTPFSTREPEPPKNSQSTWIQPTSPSYVIINLKKAISEKNANNYLRCLADSSTAPRSFIYLPDAAVNAANPNLFEKWDKEKERNYLNQLLVYLPKDCTSTVEFQLKSENTFQDSIILTQDYTLIVAHKQQQQGCPKYMKGQAEVRLIRSSEDLWYIHRWSDYATGDQPTWSALRAFFGK